MNIARVARVLSAVIDVLDMRYGRPSPPRTAPVWLPMSSDLEGLAGRIEMVGGLWVLLATWAAMLAGRLPKALNYLSVVIGLAGILTVVPALLVLGIGFRLGEMVWGSWLGTVLMRGSQHAAARTLIACFQGIDVLRTAARRRLRTGIGSSKLIAPQFLRFRLKCG